MNRSSYLQSFLYSVKSQEFIICCSSFYLNNFYTYLENFYPFVRQIHLGEKSPFVSETRHKMNTYFLHISGEFLVLMNLKVYRTLLVDESKRKDYKRSDWRSIVYMEGWKDHGAFKRERLNSRLWCQRI